MKKYRVAIRRRTSALSNDWHISKYIEFEAKNNTSALNKLDKMAKKYNNDYCRLSTEIEEA